MARIVDLQRFSIHDGPGIRTTLFLKGCPLGCSWCQNPEALDRSIRLWHFANLCAKCGRCEQVCPRRALRVTPDGVDIDTSLCDLCGKCVTACPRNALAFDGRDLSVEDAIREVLADQVFYDVSGGGVTFSGGEPLAQAEFVHDVATALKAVGVHTAIESSLYARWHSIETLLPVIDLFIVDVKIADPVQHLDATGGRSAPIIANLGRLATALNGTGRVLVRIPLIPRRTAVRENLAAIAALLTSIDPALPVELMNFNPLALAKYRRMNRAFEFEHDTAEFSPQQMAEFRQVIAERGLMVR